MPMYTAASPGNLFPKFSGPKMPAGPAGTIAHRASVLQKATGVFAAAKFAVGAHWVAGAGVAPAPGPAPTKEIAPARTAAKASLDLTIAPFRTEPPRPHESARAEPAGQPAQPRGPSGSRT